MIDRPTVGQRVVLRYAADGVTKRRPRLHREPGRVVAVSRGPGPLNHAVRLDLGGIVIVHRGNLFPEVRADKRGMRQAEMFA